MGNSQKRVVGSDAAPGPEGGPGGVLQDGDSEGHGACADASLRAALAECADVFGRLAAALGGVQEALEGGERGLRNFEGALLAHVEQRVEEAVSALEKRVEVRLRGSTGVTPDDQMSSRLAGHPSSQPVTAHQQTSISPPRNRRRGKRHVKPSSPASNNQHFPVSVYKLSPSPISSTETTSTPSTIFTSTTDSTPSTSSTISSSTLTAILPSVFWQQNSVPAAPRAVTSDSDAESVTLKKRSKFSSAQLPATCVYNADAQSPSIEGRMHPTASPSDMIPTEVLPYNISNHSNEHTSSTSENDSTSMVTKLRKIRIKKSSKKSPSGASRSSHSSLGESPPAVATPLTDAGMLGGVFRRPWSVEDDSAADGLLFAAEVGDSFTAQKLLDAGMDANARGGGGLTALHCAVATVKADTVTLLLSRGANVHARDSDGCTPLFQAATHDLSGRMATRLLAVGACVNYVNCNNSTPLHSAVNAGNVQAAKVLLQNGADVALLDSDGKTPLMLAKEPAMLIELLNPSRERLD